MERRTQISALLISIAGLGSAIFSAAVNFTSGISMLSVGFLFGAALAVYFALYEGYREPVRLAAFIIACTAAFPISLLTSAGVFMVSGADFTMGSSPGIPLLFYWGGGWLGAFLVLEAGMLLFGPGNIGWASLRKAAMWSVGGGLLAVAARLAGAQEMSLRLYLIWQPGTALLLGLLLAQERVETAQVDPFGSPWELHL